jgi:hypothetical protein
MNWDYTSVTKEEYYNLLSTIQIKNDCETWKALAPVISQPVIIFGMLPYLSLFCSSFQEYINSNITPVSIKNDSPYAISDMRSKIKLFDERYAKSQKQILLSNNLQDQEFSGRLRFPWTRSLNIHNNLGIYCDEDGHIIGNTQYIYYLFQDKSFSKSLQNPNEIRDFGQAIGTVINSVCIGLKNFLPDYFVNINDRKFKIKYKDFNTNYSFSLFPQIKNGKEVTLRLLHTLTFINFLRYVIMNLADYTNTWILRAMYITFYYAVKSIDKLVCVLDTNNSEEKKLSSTLKDSISFGDKLFDSEFRSCMMHYGFYNNGKWAIDDKYLDLHTPLFGLIESRFSDKSYAEYSNVLIDKIIKLSNDLTTMLPINLTGLREL